MIDLRLGDCLDVMRTLETASVDAIVTDPPAGIGFMGVKFDHNRGGRTQWVAWLAERLTEARRVSKPGSYMVCWALPRTSHWTGTAIEDAGWVIRDRVSHLFGTGFPKGKASLKPAMEDWWLAWNPAKKVTPLNIDKCRVGWVTDTERAEVNHKSGPNSRYADVVEKSVALGDKRPHAVEDKTHPAGRWPANLTHDGSPEVMEAFAAFGERGGGVVKPYKRCSRDYYSGSYPEYHFGGGYNDSGTAARFFYCAKASPSDRGEGNTHPTVKSQTLMRWLCRLITPPDGLILDPFAGSGSTLLGAEAEGFRTIGIEQNPEYVSIIRDRIASAHAVAS